MLGHRGESMAAGPDIATVAQDVLWAIAAILFVVLVWTARQPRRAVQPPWVEDRIRAIRRVGVAIGGTGLLACVIGIVVTRQPESFWLPAYALTVALLAGSVAIQRLRRLGRLF